MVLATAQGRLEAREGADFFPLTVDVEERMYAAGKIPGGFFKREGRPTEKAILTARMIDRPIRPLWPKGFRNEVQVICTTLSADLITPHDILAINGASAALMISPLPFLGPVGGVRIGLLDGELVVNPSLPDVETLRARPDRRRHEGRPDDGRGGCERGARGDAARGVRARARRDQEALRARRRSFAAQAASPSGSTPSSPTSSTNEPRRAHLRAHRTPRASARLQPRSTRSSSELCPPISIDSTEEDIVRETQVRASLEAILERRRLEAVMAPVRAQFEDDLRALTDHEQDSKQLRSAKRHLLFERILETSELPFPVGPATVEGEAPSVKDSLTRDYVKKAAEAIYKDLIRRKIAVEKRRPDGRATDEIRPIACEVGRLRRARTARRSSPAARRRS